MLGDVDGPFSGMKALVDDLVEGDYKGAAVCAAAVAGDLAAFAAPVLLP